MLRIERCIRMRLWTLQSENFYIKSEVIDHKKSLYYNDEENLPNIRKAYQRLRKELGENQFLWCFMKKRGIHHEYGKVLYELEVPEEKILVYLCSCVWHKIITDCKPFNNHDCWEHWTKHDKDYVEQQNIKCFSKEPENELWKRLFWPSPTRIPCPAGIILPAPTKSSMYNVLIKSLVEKNWIIKAERYQC